MICKLLFELVQHGIVKQHGRGLKNIKLRYTQFFYKCTCVNNSLQCSYYLKLFCCFCCLTECMRQHHSFIIKVSIKFLNCGANFIFLNVL